MERLFGTHKLWTGILSAGRPQNVPKMHALVGTNVTWYVQPHEQAAYAAAGATAIRDAQYGVAAARNCILTDGFAHKLDTLYFDDDLRSIKQAVNQGGGPRKGVPIAFDAAITLMADRLHGTDLYLCGGAPTNNAYFTHNDTSTNLFVIGSLHIVRYGCDLYVNEAPHLRAKGLAFTKEDYDYTLQHIATYGGALRCNDILFDWQHYTNPGGVKDARTVEAEEATIAYLLEKWPGWVKRHPRRPHEVLLNIPRRQRVIA